MKGYVQAKNSGNQVVACAKSLEAISPKSAVKVARAINGMNVNKAKQFLNSLMEGSASIHGKFYTSSATSLLNVITSAEMNAGAKGFDIEDLKLNISVHKGPKRLRSRRKRNFGLQLKLANVQVILTSSKKVAKEEIKAENAVPEKTETNTEIKEKDNKKNKSEENKE